MPATNKAFPIRNSDGATYAELRQRRLDKVRDRARLEGFWNEARDWAEWAWYHEAKAHLSTRVRSTDVEASIVKGSSSDRRIDKPAGNLYLVGSSATLVAHATKGD